MKASPIAASMAASPSRSKVESRNAPKTVPLLAARARAPSRMSAIDPITKRKPPSQKKSFSFRSSNPTSTAPARQRETPARVSMSGVSFVFATPRIERTRISRAACVYSCLTRSSWLTRGASSEGGLSSSVMRARGACSGRAAERGRSGSRARTRRGRRASSGYLSTSRRTRPRPATRARVPSLPSSGRARP